MPNRVMKPINEAIESTPPVSNTAATPPIRASGRLSMIATVAGSDLTEATISKLITTAATRLYKTKLAVARSSDSNWPP